MALTSLPLTARAPAKVNLCLHVGREREDRLHEICSLFQSVTLADDVLMESAAEGGDEIVCPDVAGPNLAAQALSRFRREHGWQAEPVRVTITKRIPLAAGLGGGSADAAAVLRLAAAAAGSEQPQLGSLAMSLGADVPSQLVPGAHLVTGAGERVEPVEGPPLLALVLLTGQATLSTRDVYRHADRLGLAERDLTAVASELRATLAGAVPAPRALAGLVHNDLEPAAIDLEPSIAQALALLRDSGALAAAVSGSGPSAFGLYAGRREADEAARALGGSWSGKVIVAGAADAAYGAPLPADTASRERCGAGQ